MIPRSENSESAQNVVMFSNLQADSQLSSQNQSHFEWGLKGLFLCDGCKFKVPSGYELNSGTGPLPFQLERQVSSMHKHLLVDDCTIYPIYWRLIVSNSIGLNPKIVPWKSL